MNELNKSGKISDYEDKSLLIVDDDNPFRERLARAMEKKRVYSLSSRGCKNRDKDSRG